ncbi:MAG: helix-turn-helix domain-containing protein [Actinomycetota bacterium]
MATRDEGERLPIGEVLKRTRTRHKIDIRTVEQQTKIRIKYLRALENEEWDVLPGSAYAKGFLRTYAQFLGLDGDALVDEYRRTVEAALDADRAYLFSEPLLERRRRPGEEPRRGWPVRASALGVLGAVAVVVLLVLGLTGSDNEGKNTQRQKGKRENAQQGSGGGSNQGSAPSQPVTVALITRDSMEVCLVTGDGRALIDGQTLISGAKEGPFQPPADNYRLDLSSGGALTLTLDGKPRPVRSQGAASYQISGDGVRPTSFRGPDCP